MTVLKNFQPHYDLLSSRDGAWFKSGTLKGVYNYAGYIRQEERFYPYVIMLTQPHNKRDTILNLLKKYLSKSD